MVSALPAMPAVPRAAAVMGMRAEGKDTSVDRTASHLLSPRNRRVGE
jgi:hypothetical protein